MTKSGTVQQDNGLSYSLVALLWHLLTLHMHLPVLVVTRYDRRKKERKEEKRVLKALRGKTYVLMVKKIFPFFSGGSRSSPQQSCRLYGRYHVREKEEGSKERAYICSIYIWIQYMDR
jgi:hypothetical protein